ncbi:MAG: putative amidohydrolase family protein, partial [Acidobacteria bacterium]|nr:putative amidohydrolase family protein [Acidobacteriota bacterium]
MKRTFLLIALLWVGMGVAFAQTNIPPELIRYPDLIVHNAKVLTVDDNFRVAEAAAIRDGVFLSVGTNAEVLRLRGPNTRVLDLQGK